MSRADSTTTPTEPPTSHSAPSRTTTLAGEPADTPPRTPTDGPEQEPRHRIATGLVIAAVTVLLTIVVFTPAALSSHDLIAWAGSPTGLDLNPPWPLLVFIALDAAAGTCVLLAAYRASRGEPAGIFGILVWCFAAGSAFANWRHSTTPTAAPDAHWFFPAMSLAGPALLHAVLSNLRRWAQRNTGRRARTMPAFGWRRWTPGLGAPRDTYGAYRTALLLGIDTVDAAITAYHQLCPDATTRVATALRNQRNTPPLPPHPPSPNLPVDLMRRIPVDPDAYQHWRTIWADLRTTNDLPATADHHHISRRQAQFIRSAGEAGLLNSPIPPAHRLAALATHPD